MIDDFRLRWAHVRGMTVEFLNAAPDDCLDFRPAASFMTVREQAAHLSEVQGIYQLALRGEEADFGRKSAFGPRSHDRSAILEALAARDDELDLLLSTFAGDRAVTRIPWYGHQLTIAGFGSVFIQHEAIHHGQWSCHAALGGFATPSGWVLNWGL